MSIEMRESCIQYSVHSLNLGSSEVLLEGDELDLKDTGYLVRIK